MGALATERECTSHQVSEDAPHLIASHDDNQEACEPDGGHGGDGVFGGGSAPV